MSHVFISYKREDADKRDSLVTALKAADIPYWYDSGIEGGEVWVETIRALC
ncbi:MAG: toll/interleukin-1 receptor domain-containing protein [Anaerolineae bacterium]|nr:toll/interleukin-1 receptor domain-containing protein [Anaerolineae bacterium]